MKILLVFLMACSGTAMGSPYASFVLQAGTTKRTGPAPAEPRAPSGVLGFPGRAGGTSKPPDAQPAQPGDQDEDPNPNRPLRRGLPNFQQLLMERARRDAGGNGAKQGQAKTPAPAPSSSVIRKKGSGVVLAFTNAPIDQVVSSVMKELGYSYIIDPQVAGTVNLYTQETFPKEKLFSVLEQLLKMNGQAIIRQEDFYIVTPISSTGKIPGPILTRPVTPRRPEQSPPGQQQNPQLGEGGAAPPPSLGPGNPATAAVPQQPESQGPTVISVTGASETEQLQAQEGVITYIIPLHYVPSSEMVTMITAFVSEGAQVVDFQSANILLVTDYRANIQQVLNLIRLLDTEYLDLNMVDLVPVRYHKAADVAEDLGKVFAPGEKAGGVRIVAIERLNSLLIVTHAPEVFAEVVKWVAKLDAPSGSADLKTFVYPVQNNTAANIAEIMAQLYEDGAGLPSGPSDSEGEEGEGRRQQQAQERRQEAGFREEGAGGRTGGGFPGLTLGPQLGGRSPQSGVRAVVTGNVKIIVNEFNNSLIIQGTDADYQFLRATIEQLDVLPRQVLIEAKIYSVELRNDLSYGVSYFLQQRQADGDLGPATTGSISPVGSEGGGGLSAATRVFIGHDRQLDFLVDALRSKTNVKILESPTLLVIDGTEAQINVGAEVPVTTASFGDPLRSGSSTSFVNSIAFRPTGTTLLILPRISASGIVTMDLAIEISNATGSALTPTINRNFVRTSLITRDRQPIAIAGVISDSEDLARDTVPLLGDIPIVGHLFGGTTKTKRRFELLFMITPYVVRTLPTAVEMTLEFKRALRNAYDFIQVKELENQETIEGHRQQEREAQQNQPDEGSSP